MISTDQQEATLLPQTNIPEKYNSALEIFLKDSHFNELQKEEFRKLAEFQPEIASYQTNNLGDVMHTIMSSPNENGVGGIFLERVPAGPDILPWFVAYGLQNPPILEKPLTSIEIESMKYTFQELKLPPLVIVHLIKNKNMTIAEIEKIYGKPISDTSIPDLFSFYGPSSQGKSLLSLQHRLLGEKVISLDKFSAKNLDYYEEKIREANLSQASLDRQIEYLTTLPPIKKEEPNFYNAYEGLDIIAAAFKDGNRPEKVYCDMPGYNSNERIRNTFDSIATESMTTIVVSRYVPEDDSTPKYNLGTKKDKIDPVVIKDYLSMNTSKEVTQVLHRISQLRYKIFYASLNGDYYDLFGAYYNWVSAMMNNEDVFDKNHPTYQPQ